MYVAQSSTTSVLLFDLKKNQNYSYFYLWQEIESVTNNVCKQFGPDLNIRDVFDLAKEKDEIKKDNWPGRKWDFDGTKISVG